MTRYDEILEDLAAQIERMPTRAKSAFFLVCARGLMPAFTEWSSRRRASSEPLLLEALESMRRFAATGDMPVDLQELLTRVADSSPRGESPDSVPTTAAQDCWICVDTAIRVVADQEFRAGPVVEFALEPMLQSVTEQIIGVSQLGSGADETAQMETVLADPALSAALGFTARAIAALSVPGTLRFAELDDLARAASALFP